MGLVQLYPKIFTYYYKALTFTCETEKTLKHILPKDFFLSRKLKDIKITCGNTFLKHDLLKHDLLTEFSMRLYPLRISFLFLIMFYLFQDSLDSDKNKATV